MASQLAMHYREGCVRRGGGGALFIFIHLYVDNRWKLVSIVLNKSYFVSYNPWQL
jgi:hypothetical protein